MLMIKGQYSVYSIFDSKYFFYVGHLLYELSKDDPISDNI